MTLRPSALVGAYGAHLAVSVQHNRVDDFKLDRAVDGDAQLRGRAAFCAVKLPDLDLQLLCIEEILRVSASTAGLPCAVRFQSCKCTSSANISAMALISLAS